MIIFDRGIVGCSVVWSTQFYKLYCECPLLVVDSTGKIEECDCVSVEQGASANIRRVSPVYCEEPEFYHPHVRAAAYEDAAECQPQKKWQCMQKLKKKLILRGKKFKSFVTIDCRIY